MKAVSQITNLLPIKYITLALFIVALLLVIITFVGLRILNKTLHEIIFVHHERTLLTSQAMMSQQVTIREDLLMWIGREALQDAPNFPTDAALTTFFDGGIMIYNQQQIPLWENDSSLRAFLLTGDTSVSRQVIDANGQQWVVLRYPIDDEYHIAGAFSLRSIDINPVFDTRIDHHFELYLTDADNNILLSPRRGSKYFDLLPADPEQPIVKQENETYLLSSREFLIPEVTLTAILPWQYVTSIAFRRILLVNALPLMLLFFAVTFVIFLYIALKDIVHPLKLLGKQASVLAWGNYEIIRKPVGGLTAIEELQDILVDMANRLQQSEQYRQGYVSAVIQGQEEERSRLAHDLHDDTIQSLVAIGQHLESIERSLENSPNQATHKLRQLQDFNRQTIDETRRIIRDMRPTYLTDLGLVTTLKKLGKDYEKANRFAIIYDLPSPTIRLSSNVEVVLYRICQEALSNVAKHACASVVSITLTVDHTVSLKIADNGRGFKVPQHPLSLVQDQHFGLITIVERVRMLNGTLSIDSSSQLGTRLTIHVPNHSEFTPQAD